jgi:signal peptidase
LLKKIWNTVTTIVMVLVVILALLLIGARVLGLQILVVMSGSMEPHYHVGSIIFVKDVPPESLQVGDDITFRISDKTVATHRIVEILPDGSSLRFRTKGTANTTTDDPVPQDRVLGKVVGTIPLLGYAFDFVKKPPGTFIAVAIAAIMAVVAFVPDIVVGIRGEPHETSPPAVAQDPPVDTAQLKAELEALKEQLRRMQENGGKDEQT